jgi:CBS domain-containing protein
MHPFSKILMEQKISEMVVPDTVHTCAPETPVASVVKTLQDSKVGSIIITDGNRPIGIFTERDYLVKVAGHKMDETKTTVEAVMTKNPVCFTKDESVGKVLNRMKTAGFRHIIVTDAEGSLEGIISIRDAMAFLLDNLSKD